MKGGAAGQRGGRAAKAHRDPTFPIAVAPPPPPASRVTGTTAPLDVDRIREDFPILRQRIRGKRLVYLDNAATSQKPQAVIDAITRFYTAENANIHRGVHYLSEQATAAYDQAREKTARFLNARSSAEIIFTRGTTDGINLVAQSYARTFLKAGDEILITGMEHHSNIVPWQLVCEQTGAVLRAAPISDAGELEVEAFERLLNDRTRFVSVVHLSNALGTINPVKHLIQLAHARGIPVLVDGAQSAPHLQVDVQELDCDFFAFSGHKVYGPTGVGVLYGRETLLDRMPPYQGGGDMIATVTLQRSTWAPLPAKFEAGTPMIAEAIGLGAAIDYVSRLGLDAIATWEKDLLGYATERVSRLEGIRLIGTAREKATVLGFVLDGVHPHDIGTVLDDAGVAIRAGHHCAQPVMERFGVPATARASFAFYNTRPEVDVLVDGLVTVRKMFG
ncbi:MAG TPA: cysteine desulfurase [Gemmatimonadales bacterium]|jgi:cysteine desulfurase/selenocysteine lyase|nr:cysteine desulfurase [Gemmatimonadales bacterium]